MKARPKFIRFLAHLIWGANELALAEGDVHSINHDSPIRELYRRLR